MKAELFKIGKSDFFKGLIMAVIAAILTGLYTSIESGHFPNTTGEFKAIGLSAIGAAVTYLMKNWLSNSEGKFLKKEDEKPV